MRSRRLILLLAIGGIVVVQLLGLLTLPLLAGSRPAYAATITVTTTSDELNADNDCSLREAIQAANTDAAVDACTAGSGTDTINAPAGVYTLNIAGAGEYANATGDLDVLSNVAISGAGAATTIVDGADLDRVFYIGGGVTAQISGLTIQNGDGGGIANGGALTLNNSTVSGNSAPVDYGTGGISNGGTLTLNNSTVSGNSAIGDYGTGGIENFQSASLTVNNSIVSGNSATGDYGTGGIENFQSATALLTNSTVSGNSATIYGTGGIQNFQSASLTLYNSTVSSNAATGDYGIGGIQNFQSATATLNNSTISGNNGGPYGGGGIESFQFATLTLNNSTVSSNSNSNLHNDSSGTATLVNTILANGGITDCVGAVTSGGHNLIENTTGCTITGDTASNIIGVKSFLGPLADNGGPTQTHALLAGSPAIDAGTNVGCPATDQRGVARPLDGNGDATSTCDIGAYEIDHVKDPSLDSDGDGCTDAREQQPKSKVTQGGGRDYLNPYDYFNPSHDGQNRVDDILLVVQAYFKDDNDVNPGLPPYAPGYNPDTDRTLVGPNAWNSGPPDGLQRVDDILNAVHQYYHDCS